MNTFRFRIALLFLVAVQHATAATVWIKPRVKANAANCSVKVTLVDAEGKPTPLASSNAPFDLPRVRIREGARLLFEAEAPDHQAIRSEFDQQYCVTKLDQKSGFATFDLELERIREELPVRLASIPNATFRVEGSPVSTDTTLVFNKQGASWQFLAIRADAPGYEGVGALVSHESMAQRPRSGGRYVIDLDLSQKNLASVVRVKAEFNVSDPEILSETLAEPARKHEDGSVSLAFNFKRDRADAEWSRARLKVAKPGYEWADAGEAAQPVFEREFARGDLEKLGGTLELRSFQPMKFVLTPLLAYNVDNRAAMLATNNFLAAVTDAEPGAALHRHVRSTKTARLVQSSISAPKGAGRIYFAMANYEFNQASEAVLKGSTIYFSEKKGLGLPTPLTSKPAYQDTDPAVSPNGKLVVFSSFVSGTRCIRQVESKGGIAFPVSEDPRFIDTQPAITDRGRLAFTRRTVNAPPGTPPQITVQAVDENGQPQAKLFGPVCDGHSPAWNPDGNRLAFIDGEGRLCLVSLDDSQPRPLLDGAIHASPSWDSLGKTVYFAAEKERNERGQRHYDLFRLGVAEDGTATGTPQPLTSNASLDIAPIFVEEKESSAIYFLSNRGATRYGDDESLAIFSLKLQ